MLLLVRGDTSVRGDKPSFPRPSFRPTQLALTMHPILLPRHTDSKSTQTRLVQKHFHLRFARYHAADARLRESHSGVTALRSRVFAGFCEYCNSNLDFPTIQDINHRVRWWSVRMDLDTNTWNA
jgi:hypothetical protein